jgi:hypothetical protein
LTTFHRDKCLRLKSSFGFAGLKKEINYYFSFQTIHSFAKLTICQLPLAHASGIGLIDMGLRSLWLAHSLRLQDRKSPPEFESRQIEHELKPLSCVRNPPIQQQHM